MQRWPKHIFRAYGIRGDVDSEVSESLAWHLGWHVARLLKEPKKELVVAWDTRLSSPRLADAVMRGAREAGVVVCCLGIAPTPLAYFFVHNQDKAGCVIITGSHNPAHQNGFKIMIGKEPITEVLYQRLRQHISQEPESNMLLAQKKNQQALPLYMQHVSQKISLQRRLKIVVDAGNGTGGMVAVPLYRLLGCQVEPLFCALDGRFPHHHPDPSEPKNLLALKAKVQGSGADIGIAFDGDADRLAVIDAQGNEFSADHLMMLFAQDILQKKPCSHIVSEVRSPLSLIDLIADEQGHLHISACGHAAIQRKMKREKAVLGGEMNGHLFFADDFYGFDDGIYAGARLLQLLSQQQLPLAKLRPIASSVLTPELRFACADTLKFAWIEHAQQWFEASKYPVCVLDGVRVSFEMGWCLLRASNTQAMLSLRMEARDHENFMLIYDVLMDFLSSQSVLDSCDFQKEIMACVSENTGKSLAYC